jgi:hypothetical protein
MGKKYDILKNIINTNNEFRPTEKDSQWTNAKNKTYFVMKASKHYSITNKLINLMEKYSKIYESINGNEKDHLLDKPDDTIGIIYLVENEKTSERYVGYTTNSLFNIIKLNMHNSNIGIDNVFDNFSNIRDQDLTDYSFEMIEYIKYNIREDLLERRNFHSNIYVKNKNGNNGISGENGVNGVSGETDNAVKILACGSKNTKNNKKKKKDFLDKIYEKRMEIFFELLGAQVGKFKSMKGYVYRLNNIENKKSFIGGYHKRLSKKNILDILIKGNKQENLLKDIHTYGRRAFNMEILDKYDSKTPFDFLVRIDFFKIKFNSIESGYNQGFSFVESEDLFSQRLLTRKKRIMSRNIFLKIQKHLFEKNFTDPNNYDNMYGFVYQIQHKKNNMRYIGFSHLNELKNIIVGLYDQALEGNVKHSKILKAFEVETFDSFSYKVIKKKKMDDYKISLSGEAESLIFKHRTIENGYNMDNKKLRRNIANSKKK